MVKISCYFERQQEDLTMVTFFQVSKSNETQRILIFTEEIKRGLVWYAVWVFAFFATFLIGRWTYCRQWAEMQAVCNLSLSWWAAAAICHLPSPPTSTKGREKSQQGYLCQHMTDKDLLNTIHSPKLWWYSWINGALLITSLIFHILKTSVSYTWYPFIIKLLICSIKNIQPMQKLCFGP